MNRVLIAALLVSAMVLAGPAQAAPAKAAVQGSADARLKALYNGYASWDAKESGYFEDQRGESKPSDYLPRVDPASNERRAAHLQQLLTQLNAIPEAQLSPAERVNGSIRRPIAVIWEWPYASRHLLTHRSSDN